MPGLTLIGPLAATARTPCPDPVQAGAETSGMIVLGDARDIAMYSAMDLGSRWLCRAEGPALRVLGALPTEDGEAWGYGEKAEAFARYDALRAHILARFPGVTVQDARADLGPNSPEARAESFVQGGTLVVRMFVDHMADLQIVTRNTDAIWTFAGHPRAPDRRLVAYSTQSDVLYVAIGKGASGAAEHVCVLYAPEHRPEPTVSQGMPRAERQETAQTIQLTSGFLVAFWGVVPGARLMAPAQGGDPAPMLHAYMAANVAVPLATHDPSHVDQRAQAPCAWAIRVEPGEYEVSYRELDARGGAGFSFVALSKKGAQPFQPDDPGQGAGRRIQGFSLAQYAMLSVERERILMAGPMAAGQPLTELCQRYGLEVPMLPYGGGVNTGYAGRIVEWDQAIQGEPAMTAAFLAEKQLASMRLTGMAPSPEQEAAIRAGAGQQAAMIAQTAAAQRAATNEEFDGAVKLIELARSRNEQQIIDEARRLFPVATAREGTPASGIGRALTILKNPGEGQNPRVANVQEITEKLARAHHRAMTPEDQKFEGSEKSYVKEVIETVYDRYGLPIPGAGGFLGRLMDKL